MIDHDRRQRERIKAISLGCLGYFGNRIFFYTTWPSRAPVPSPYESGPLCCFNVRIVSCGWGWCGSLPSPQDYDVNVPNFSFYGGRKKPDRSSRLLLNLHIFLRNWTLRPRTVRLHLIKWAIWGNRSVVHVEAILECKVTIQTAFARATRIMPDRASVQAHMKDSCGVEISVTRGKLHHADLERGASRIG